MYQPAADGSDWSQTVTETEINSTAHQHARDDAALQSIVLLQNEPHPDGGGKLLPLVPGQKIGTLLYMHTPHTESTVLHLHRSCGIVVG